MRYPYCIGLQTEEGERRTSREFSRLCNKQSYAINKRQILRPFAVWQNCKHFSQNYWTTESTDDCVMSLISIMRMAINAVGCWQGRYASNVFLPMSISYIFQSEHRSSILQKLLPCFVTIMQPCTICTPPFLRQTLLLSDPVLKHTFLQQGCPIYP